jgi:hypothetical protein
MIWLAFLFGLIKLTCLSLVGALCIGGFRNIILAKLAGVIALPFEGLVLQLWVLPSSSLNDVVNEDGFLYDELTC